ncbi:MAG TPA: aspartate kinase [Ktedonobacteraceae bacterium]|nr:aspartate kinase [Ktedonobacteraceae bacterium]
MERSVQVLKFGGTSVGGGERIRRVANIIAHHLQDSGMFPVIVVSAMSDVTDQLLRIARFACTGDQEACRQELDALKQKHLEGADKAVHKREGRQALQHDLQLAFSMLEQDISAVEAGRIAATKEAAHENLIAWALHAAPTISAWGERLSVLLVAAALRDLGVQAIAVGEEVIITSDLQIDTLPSFGTVTGADPLPQETRVNARRLIHPLIERGVVPVAPGFIGRTSRGFITTLGRNGSDYSATVIGEALDCVEVTIYSDVDGVLSADPRIVANTRLLPRLSYAEAARLSWFGAKVLHPRTLIPVAHRNIPVRVRNTFRPHTRGTVVGPELATRSAAAAITVRRQLALITVENTDLFGAPENAGQVFALAARAGAAPVAICSSSGHHLAFVVEEQAVDPVIALLQHDMGSWRVSHRRGLAVCACIGSGFTADPMSPARAITALARERIPIITQGASDTGIILIVEESDSERALRCLHRDLIAPVIPLVRHEKQETHEKRREVSQI